jgi:hypothetical protein
MKAAVAFGSIVAEAGADRIGSGTRTESEEEN